MTTPTEPTTPQPNAAGLLPCPFCGGTFNADYSGTGHQEGCFLLISKRQPVTRTHEAIAEHSAQCDAAWNRRPLPTPHAAEAGVREWSPMLDTGSVRISLCDNGTLEINDGGAIYALSEPETTAMLKWLAARHTVGTGEAVTALDPSNHEVKVAAKIHELCLERGAENVSTMELAAVLFRNRLPTERAAAEIMGRFAVHRSERNLKEIAAIIQHCAGAGREGA